MAEASVGHTKLSPPNEAPLNTFQAEKREALTATSKIACRTSGIHKQANALLYFARENLNSALELLPSPVEANDRVVAAKGQIKEACSILPSLRLAHADLASQVCRSASPYPCLNRGTNNQESAKYEINKLLQLVQEALDWVACNKEHYDRTCQRV